VAPKVSFEKGVRVDGKIEGKISTKGYLGVSQGGKLQADVDAGNIIVEGQVTGNLNASDRVELRKTARLKGDIRANKLLVAEGAAFTGQCQVGPDTGAGTAPAPNRMTGKEAVPRK
jgi:cytoskeletal protein CcmA (bactofilin family)